MPVAETAVLAPTLTQVLPLDQILPPGRPLEVDVGCGKGRFLTVRAQTHPDTNFIGIDRLLRRIRKADTKVRRLGLPNVRLLRLEASYAIRHLFPPSSVDAFFFFFPDPWPKRRHHRRRLFTAEFVTSLHRTLRPQGRFHIATDHTDYLEAIRGLLAGDDRFRPTPPFEPTEDERTEFERIFRGQNVPIGRCSFERV